MSKNAQKTWRKFWPKYSLGQIFVGRLCFFRSGIAKQSVCLQQRQKRFHDCGIFYE